MPRLVDCAEQLRERVRLMEQPKPRRVGRTDVDLHRIGQRFEPAVAPDDLLDGHAGDADHDRRPAPRRPVELKLPGGGREALARKSHRIDERGLARVAEQPRLRVARPRMHRHRAHGEVSESERGQGRDHLAVLVEPCRKPDGVQEGKSAQRRMKPPVSNSEPKAQRLPRHLPAQRLLRDPLRRLRRQPEQQRPDNVRVGVGIQNQHVLPPSVNGLR